MACPERSRKGWQAQTHALRRLGKANSFIVYPPFADKKGGQKSVAHPTRLVKPETGVSLMRKGCPSSSSDSAATKSTLFS